MFDANAPRAKRALSILFLMLGFGLLGLGACEGNFNSNAECVPQCGERECGGDGCGGTCGICGPGKACSLDGACRLASCGDSKLDPGEQCDSAIASGEEGACTTADECVDDGSACTTEQFFGSAENCDATCTRFTVIRCIDSDGCCPDGCNDSNDSDCSENCDNGEVDDNETCDPPSSCPTIDDCTAPEACQRPELAGAASTCSAECVTVDITACVDGDGCCPTDCTSDDDDDCEPVQAVCDNGTLEQGENCDPGIAAGMAGTCPEDPMMDCDDSDACTTESIDGMASDCSAMCVNTPITACTDDDGCCVPTCTSNMDNDCSDLCTTFCTDVTATCVGAEAAYTDMAECLAACGDFVIGDEGDSNGDTLQCRITHLGLAVDMNDTATHCPHTAATSGPCS